MMTGFALAMTVDCNARHVLLEPYEGPVETVEVLVTLDQEFPDGLINTAHRFPTPLPSDWLRAAGAWSKTRARSCRRQVGNRR